VGAHPFAGGDVRQFLELPSRRVAAVPRDAGLDSARWDAFFACALAPRADDRPSSARELVNAFERACDASGPAAGARTTTP